MAISYPITLPVRPAPKRITFRPRSVVGISASPFTLQQQLYVHQGQVWQADIMLPIMRRAIAEPWIAAFLSLNGMQGTFYLGDPLGIKPRGSVPGTPVVDGASQTGQELNTRGWTVSQTGILLAGDWIQLGDRLHKNLTDADSDGSGEAVLDIWPRMRESPADGATIITSNCKGLFRLASNEMPYDENIGARYETSFSVIEAI